MTWLYLVGAIFFGLVVGWVAYRTLRRSQTRGLSDILTVIGVVGGAAVTALFRPQTDAFGMYCIGLAVGFFGYLISSILLANQIHQLPSVNEWLGEPPQVAVKPGDDGAPIDRGLMLAPPGIEEAPSEIAGWGEEPPVLEAQPHPPRVLNSNFADLQGGVLDPNDALVSGREYNLLVDVGPVWSKIKSIVTGPANFPEDALPPDQDEYVVQVVVISEDFSPRMTSAEMVVPRRTGSSFPIENGKRAALSGPVALRLRAPALPSDSITPIITARARLCLYYKNNLLQSAIVRVGVAGKEGTKLEWKNNTVEVDYVLTSSFQQVEKHLAGRALKFTPVDDTADHPVRMNLTLNDDGANGHRIIISHQIGNDATPVPPQETCPPRGWTAYDPSAAADNLKSAREELQNVFFSRNANDGSVKLNGNQPISWDFQGHQNGKTREQFLWDLIFLAKMGRTLYNSVFGSISPETGDCSSHDLTKSLENTLTTPSIIQIARTNTVPAQYVFPWALLYAYPLDAGINQLHICRITNEWNDTGIRSAPTPEEEAKQRQTCPYEKEDTHRSNVICPYGFWGLRHIIEQPPSVLRKQNGNWALRDAVKEIQTSTQPCLSIGVTRDTNLNTASVDQHLTALGRLLHITPSEAAIDWTAVQSMLMAPEIVYFLCHDIYDPAQKDSYLHVGPNDHNSDHKIYSGNLMNWGDLSNPPGPDEEKWEKRRPFIFINGCHTADLAPGITLNFVTAFSWVGASGVLGTEVSVLLPVAIEVAQALFEKLTQGIPIGQALYEIRWQLVNKGNLLGLAYTLYGLADLHIVKENK